MGHGTSLGRVPPDRIYGRLGERDTLARYAAQLGPGCRSLLLLGEPGIGKTTLWRHGVEMCRAAGAHVLVARPDEEDRLRPGQGLLDLLHSGAPQGSGVALLATTASPLERVRGVHAHLRELAQDRPLVLAVDDLPWMDDVSVRALRFTLRRPGTTAVSVLATARTPAPLLPAAVSPVPDLGQDLDTVLVPPLLASQVRRLVRARFPGTSWSLSRKVSELSRGNPFLALELARSPGDPEREVHGASALLDVLRHRVQQLPPATVHLARLLAIAGATPLPVLVPLVTSTTSAASTPSDASAASSTPGIEAVLQPGLQSDLLHLEADFLLRLAHPMVGVAALQGLSALDRCDLHRQLAQVVRDPDDRASHLARATMASDDDVAGLVEQAAARLADRGAQQAAAELYAHSARLTTEPASSSGVRRRLAELRHTAAAGDVMRAGELATALLRDLPPGALRAEVAGRRVELDLLDAEPFLLQGLLDLDGASGSEVEMLRGRLLGLLGWLLALHLGRPEEGLEHARAGLALGRAHCDITLVAQTAATVDTALLLLGRPLEGLIEEAVRLGAEVERQHLITWPRVLLGRHQMWQGHLSAARASHEAMLEQTLRLGVEVQLSYRWHDLAMVALAEGDLDRAAQETEAGTDLAISAGDAEAEVWLAYPAGMVAALRGDRARALEAAGHLDRRAARAGQRPRSAMAAHLRGTLAAAARNWPAALEHYLAALSVLDHAGIAHPGVVPVLPPALLVAVLADRTDLVPELAHRLDETDRTAPWVRAQVLAAKALVGVVGGDAAAVAALTEAHSTLLLLGYQLDGARLACVLGWSAARSGRTVLARPAIEHARTFLAEAAVRGWAELAAELGARVCGEPGLTSLTATETQVATLVAEGCRNKDIARRLYVSESTVEAHLTRIYRKLGLRNRAALTSRVRDGAATNASPGAP